MLLDWSLIRFPSGALDMSHPFLSDSYQLPIISYQIPMSFSSDSHQSGLPRTPKSSQGLPRVPKGPQELPKTPKSSQELPRTPMDSHGLPRAPTGSQELPKTPKDSQGLPRAPKSSQGLPRVPKGSQELFLSYPFQIPKFIFGAKTTPSYYGWVMVHWTF